MTPAATLAAAEEGSYRRGMDGDKARSATVVRHVPVRQLEYHGVNRDRPFCTAIALLAIGVGASRSAPYGRNRRRPRRSLAEGLTPRMLCVSTAAALFLASGVLQTLH